MRSGSNQRPGNRFRGNQPSQPRSGQSQNSQTFDSHGPGDRVRGNASQIYERYLTLAREAARSDDRIASENYYQHAEHYFRLSNVGRDGHSAAASPPIEHAAVETVEALIEPSETAQPAIPPPEV